MNSELYKAARSGDVVFLRGNKGSTLLNSQKTPNGNSALHIAAQFNQLDFFKIAVDLCPPELLNSTSFRGDTALHFAAREGSIDVVDFIINPTCNQLHSDIEKGTRAKRRRAACKKLLQSANDDGDNALHLAARYGHDGVAELLLNADPQLAQQVNRAGESACFMATVRNNMKMVELLLSIEPPCSLSGDANGMTVLHAAILHGPSHQDIVGKIVTTRKEVIREGDAIGWTPLHYAACLGSVDTIKLLLNSDPSAAYLVGEEGESALHIAAFSGHVNVMDVLVDTHPDCWELVNKNGQTALHAAVLGKQVDTVKYIVGFSGLKGIDRIADKDGNTALRLAALCKDTDMVNILSEGKNNQERRLLFQATRKTNLGDHEIISEVKDVYGEGLDKVLGLQQTHGKAIYTGSTMLVAERSQMETKAASQGDHEYTEGSEFTDDPEFINIVATLIATFTFAAGFTMPGGYIQSGSANEGMAVLASHKNFRAFLICDVLAFFTAFSVVMLQMMTGFTSRETRKKIPAGRAHAFAVVYRICLISAFVFTSLAFTFGVSVVLSNPGGFGTTILNLCKYLFIACMLLAPAVYMLEGLMWVRDKCILSVAKFSSTSLLFVSKLVTCVSSYLYIALHPRCNNYLLHE